MNKDKWWNNPKIIDFWENDIDYVMFVDENGSAGKLIDISKRITNAEKIDENDRFFTVTGCIFTKGNYLNARSDIEELKNKYWVNSMYYDCKNNYNKYVCLHSREIRRHDKAFNDKLINHNNFTNDLTCVLKNIDCTIISINIDLVNYLKRRHTENIYEKAFDLLIERYIYATNSNKKGIIILEARGKEEDKILLKHIYKIINLKGEKFISNNEFKKKIKGVYFNPKWNEEYSSTYVGLEIVDLFSYPIHQYVKYKKTNPAFEVLKYKISGYPNFINKGLKIFPQK